MQSRRALAAALFLAWTAVSPLAAAAPAFAAGESGPDTQRLADAVERMRSFNPGLAESYSQLQSKLDALIARYPQPPGIPAPVLGEFQARLHQLKDLAAVTVKNKALTGEDAKAFDTAHEIVDRHVSALCLTGADSGYKQVAAVLTELEARADKLKSDVDAAGAGLGAAANKPFQDRLNQLNADGTQAWNLLHTVALNVDDSGKPMKYETGKDPDQTTDEGAAAMQANPLQMRVAKLAKELQALDVRLNGAPRRSDRRADIQAEQAQSAAMSARMTPLLTDPFGHGPLPPETSDGALSGPVPAPREKGVFVVSQPKKTLLDVGRIPMPESAADGPSGSKRPVYTGKKGQDAAPEETKTVDALRAAGATRTIGDPEKRARLVYEQTGGGCAIAAQVEVLADMGLVPPKKEKLEAKEDELYARAVKLGYLSGSSAESDRRENNGIFAQYDGDLLDMPIRKQYAASDADLFEAVSTGRMIIVGVDCERLWNDAQYRNGGHAVVITGAELELKTGKLLGYYINDTGMNQGGRFVPAGLFLTAWHKRGSSFVEPL
ncbi:MAG: hypothetical protein ACHQ49_14695 [Elusimicrobiota bacterium]